MFPSLTHLWQCGSVPSVPQLCVFTAARFLLPSWPSLPGGSLGDPLPKATTCLKEAQVPPALGVLSVASERALQGTKLRLTFPASCCEGSGGILHMVLALPTINHFISWWLRDHFQGSRGGKQNTFWPSSFADHLPQTLASMEVDWHSPLSHQLWQCLRAGEAKCLLPLWDGSQTTPGAPRGTASR